MNLDQQMRQILAELELISHGGTAAWNSAGGHGAAGHRILAESNQTVPDEPHEHYRKKYTECTTDQARARVLADAIAELKQIKVRQAIALDVEETAVELDARIVAKLDQAWSVKEVAIHIRCTETRVRAAAARLIDDRPTDGIDIVELMRRPGMTIRSAAMRTGLSKSEIHRRLNASEAA